ncbi:hypothetical protein GCM10009554_21590 [Kribbella koreensis]|uniref:Uncharacterized protein n=1 Tax=Kribbella koreensis TaxID=57909 RepID=A0ABP4ADG2_9ACTN
MVGCPIRISPGNPPSRGSTPETAPQPPNLPSPAPGRRPRKAFEGLTPELVGCPARFRRGNPPSAGLTPEMGGRPAGFGEDRLANFGVGRLRVRGGGWLGELAA